MEEIDQHIELVKPESEGEEEEVTLARPHSAPIILSPRQGQPQSQSQSQTPTNDNSSPLMLNERKHNSKNSYNNTSMQIVSTKDPKIAKAVTRASRIPLSPVPENVFKRYSNNQTILQ